MGCWYGTDALTQLAIKGGNPVRLILLTPKKGADNKDFVCYSNDLYDPYGLPIRGRYDDYGSIKNIKMDVHARFLEHYFQSLYAEGKIELSKDFRDDIGGGVSTKDKPKTVDLAKVLGWIERGYVKIGGKRILYMMVLDKVYERTMEIANTFNRNNFSSEMDGSYRAQKEEKVKILFDTLRAEHEAAKQPEPKSEEQIRKIIRDAWSASDGVWMCEYSNEFLRFDFREYIRDNLAGINDKEFKEAQSLTVDYFVFKEFMNRARKLYTPQAGGGSQDDSIHLQTALANVTLEICKSRSKERGY